MRVMRADGAPAWSSFKRQPAFECEALRAVDRKGRIGMFGERSPQHYAGAGRRAAHQRNCQPLKARQRDVRKHRIKSACSQIRRADAIGCLREHIQQALRG
jgi:hypothetical protein